MTKFHISARFATVVGGCVLLAIAGRLIGCEHPRIEILLINSVYPVDTLHAWAGGDGGVFLTANGGKTWKTVLDSIESQLPTNNPVFKRRLGQVLYASKDKALVRLPDGVAAVSASGSVEVRPLDRGFWEGFRQIIFLDESRAWAAAGVKGKFPDLYFTKDGGRSWTQVAMEANIYGLFAPDVHNVWVDVAGAVLAAIQKRRNLTRCRGI